MSPTPGWVFEEFNPDHSNTSGMIAKLVRNTTLDHPGVFGYGEIGEERPSDEAGLLAREAIQNSWDNARERAQETDTEPECRLEFRFLELVGSEKATFVEACLLHELAERARQIPTEATGFADPTTYERLDDLDHPLRIMQLIEVFGTTGMYGPWTGKNSRLNQALLNVGFTKKAVGLGGSYGYGKAGLIRCSGLRVVAGYTAFDRTHDDTTDRRFIAVNYWGDHDLDGKGFTGWARLGDGLKPVEGDPADRWAERFGMELRAIPPEHDGLGVGTTLALLDPIVEPKDVSLAIERYWWPALTRKHWDLQILVKGYEGEEYWPSPRTNPDLAPFVEAYDWIQNSPGDNTRNTYLQGVSLSAGGPKLEPGVVGLVSQDSEPSWTWPDEEDPIAHRSLIALCRDPRMVVSYLDCGQTKPFIRGVFVTGNQQTNDLLTQTEAGMHVEWTSDGQDPDVSRDAYHLAGETKKKIKSTVARERSRLLNHSTRKSTDAHLPELAKFMKDFFGGGRGTKRKVDNLRDLREISIQFPEPAEPEWKPEGVRSKAAISFEPMPDFKAEAPLKVRISIAYKLQEDGGAGTQWPCDVKGKLHGFKKSVVDGRLILEGLLDSLVVFHVESDPHDEEWTGDFHPDADRIDKDSGSSDG